MTILIIFIIVFATGICYTKNIPVNCNSFSTSCYNCTVSYTSKYRCGWNISNQTCVAINSTDYNNETFVTYWDNCPCNSPEALACTYCVTRDRCSWDFENQICVVSIKPSVRIHAEICDIPDLSLAAITFAVSIVWVIIGIIVLIIAQKYFLLGNIPIVDKIHTDLEPKERKIDFKTIPKYISVLSMLIIPLGLFSFVYPYQLTCGTLIIMMIVLVTPVLLTPFKHGIMDSFEILRKPVPDLVKLLSEKSLEPFSHPIFKNVIELIGEDDEIAYISIYPKKSMMLFVSGIFGPIYIILINIFFFKIV